MADIQDTLKARQLVHGSFAENALLTQALYNVMANSRNWHDLTAVQKTGLQMVQHKISRILSGDADFDDHWFDAIGYLTKVMEDIQLRKHMAAQSFAPHPQASAIGTASAPVQIQSTPPQSEEDFEQMDAETMAKKLAPDA